MTFIIILGIIVYIVLGSMTARLILTKKGYETYKAAFKNGDDVAFVFGGIFWPITLLIFLGNFLFDKIKDKF